MQDPIRFIRVMAGLVNASLEKLGYHQAIERYVHQSSPASYVYRVGDRFFRTCRSISERSLLRFTTRGTRVWEVEEVKQGRQGSYRPMGKPRRVLKHVALSTDVQTEKVIQEDIFQALDKLAELPSAPLRHEPNAFTDAVVAKLRNGSYKDLFLTIVADAEGRPTPQRPADASRTTTLFSSVEAAPKPATPGSDPRRAREYYLANQDSVQDVFSPDASVARTFPPRRQYFVVYEEVCTALDEVRTFGDFLIGLKGGLEGMVTFCCLLIPVLILFYATHSALPAVPD